MARINNSICSMVRIDRFIITTNKDVEIDIFVGDFAMCHKIPLEDRLTFDPVTIPLAELLLSKAQIVQLNRKDALDITSLLFNNEAGDGDSQAMSLKILSSLCSNDWGLYKTASINLGKVKDLMAKDNRILTQDERDLVLARIQKI